MIGVTQHVSPIFSSKFAILNTTGLGTPPHSFEAVFGSISGVGLLPCAQDSNGGAIGTATLPQAGQTGDQYPHYRQPTATIISLPT